MSSSGTDSLDVIRIGQDERLRNDAAWVDLDAVSAKGGFCHWVPPLWGGRTPGARKNAKTSAQKSTIKAAIGISMLDVDGQAVQGAGTL